MSQYINTVSASSEAEQNPIWLHAIVILVALGKDYFLMFALAVVRSDQGQILAQ